MRETKDSEDLPKIVASVIATIPPLVLRTGAAYLKMRKRAQRASKRMEQELVSGGIPAEYAERLATQFATDLSVRRMIQSMDVPFGGTRR